MSRYRICAIFAFVLGGLAFAFGKPAWCWLVFAVLAGLIGFGVAFPQLKFFVPLSVAETTLDEKLP